MTSCRSCAKSSARATTSPEDHLPDDRTKPEHLLAGIPQQLQPADRGDGRHDRDRHRRQAARVRDVPAGREEPQLLRADEGARRSRHHRRRTSKRSRRTPSKTHFVIVDASGVCESEMQDSRPLDCKPQSAWTSSWRPWRSEARTRKCFQRWRPSSLDSTARSNLRTETRVGQAVWRSLDLRYRPRAGAGN